MPTIFFICVIGFIIALSCYVIMEFLRPYPPGSGKDYRERRRTDRLEQKLIDHRNSENMRIEKRESQKEATD